MAGERLGKRAGSALWAEPTPGGSPERVALLGRLGGTTQLAHRPRVNGVSQTRRRSRAKNSGKRQGECLREPRAGIHCAPGSLAMLCKVVFLSPRAFLEAQLFSLGLRQGCAAVGLGRGCWEGRES